jgi:REP element-mobilizing transposase RayT
MAAEFFVPSFSMPDKIYYRRKLPHIQPRGATFFVTYRLAGSMPVAVLESLKEKHKQKIFSESIIENLCSDEYFIDFENAIESEYGPQWLKINGLAKLVLDSLLFNDSKQYKLWAATVMSNHVHALITTFLNSPLLNVILQHHKRFTAVQCNKILGRYGSFWEHESFDTVIRNRNHFFNTIKYILNNPVKANLTMNWHSYPFSYLNPSLTQYFK